MDIDLSTLNRKKEAYGYELDVQARFGTSFHRGSRMKASVLKSGITILEGVDDIEAAEELKNTILSY